MSNNNSNKKMSKMDMVGATISASLEGAMHGAMNTAAILKAAGNNIGHCVSGINMLGALVEYGSFVVCHNISDKVQPEDMKDSNKLADKFIAGYLEEEKKSQQTNQQENK